MVRILGAGDQALIVVHTFAAPLPGEIVVPLLEDDWQVSTTFRGTDLQPVLLSNERQIVPTGEFDALVLHITRE